jgi:hypothetical protein
MKKKGSSMQRNPGKRCQLRNKGYFMGNKSFAWVTFILLTSFFSACKKKDIKLSSDINSVPIYHCTDESALLYICFDSLLTDSRCPAGAVCFWQGTALIKISVHEAANTHSFVMSLKGFPGLSYPGDTTINGYTIIFTDLKPYPAINGPGDETSKASFSITP